jgi:hypothetical protein
MWRPKVSFEPPTLNDATEWANDRIRAARDTAQDVARNTIDDVRRIFGNTEDCLSSLDSARLTLTHRTFEYANRAVQENLEPMIEWIARVGVRWPRRQPNPRLERPTAATKKNVFSFDFPVTWEQIAPSDIHADNVLFFVHGLNTVLLGPARGTFSLIMAEIQAIVGFAAISG